MDLMILDDMFSIVLWNQTMASHCFAFIHEVWEELGGFTRSPWTLHQLLTPFSILTVQHPPTISQTLHGTGMIIYRFLQYCDITNRGGLKVGQCMAYIFLSHTGHCVGFKP